jgi:hypothetical protein
MRRSDIHNGRTYKSAYGTVRKVTRIVVNGMDSDGLLFSVHYTRVDNGRKGVTYEDNFAKWAIEEVVESEGK